MVTEYYFNDDELGKILIKRSLRARKIAIHVKNGEVILVIPQNVKESIALDFLQKSKTKISQFLKNRHIEEKKIYDENTKFSTLTFELKIERCDSEKTLASLKNNILFIAIPIKETISSKKNQELIKNIILKAMYIEAKRALPNRVAELSIKFGFEYNRVTIRHSQSRWGSCSSKKNISLSVYLMQLPPILLDYVILHELCHTKEMNHGEKFWNLLNNITDGKAKEYRRSLTNYRTFI